MLPHGGEEVDSRVTGSFASHWCQLCQLGKALAATRPGLQWSHHSSDAAALSPCHQHLPYTLENGVSPGLSMIHVRRCVSVHGRSAWTRPLPRPSDLSIPLRLAFLPHLVCAPGAVPTGCSRHLPASLPGSRFLCPGGAVPSPELRSPLHQAASAPSSRRLLPRQAGWLPRSFGISFISSFIRPSMSSAGQCLNFTHLLVARRRGGGSF